jgi:hypothetical protein
MGLDTIALKLREGKDPQDEEAFENPENLLFEGVTGLVGGMFSGHGDGSFRGKVYDSLVTDVTGQSLYQELIDPKTAAGMASELEHLRERMDEEALQAWLVQQYGQSERYGSLADIAREREPQLEPNFTVAEVEALAKFFRVCADNDLYVHGWW